MADYGYLKKLVDEIKGKDLNSIGLVPDLTPGVDNDAFTLLCSTFFDAVGYFNNASGEDLIIIDNLSSEIFQMIFNSYDLSRCFYLLSKERLVFVFNENSNRVVFWGRHRLYNNQTINARRNFIQLFKLDYHIRDDVIDFRDNTGNELSINDIVYQILKWLLT